MDGILNTGSSTAAIATLKSHLHSHFSIKDLDDLKFFLGLEIARNNTSICLHRRKYTLDIIQEIGLTAAKSSLLPMSPNHHLATDLGPQLPNPDIYRRLVGRLIYLTSRRPEIAYSVHVLSQFPAQPQQSHLDASLKVVKFLNNPQDKAYSFQPLILPTYQLILMLIGLAA